MYIKPTPETIWKRPAYLPHVEPPLTESDIRQAEAQLGHALPKAMLDLLRVQNGGPIRFSLPNSVGDEIAGIGPSGSLLTNCQLEDFQDWVDFSQDNLFPFDGDGHWYHCLDYRENAEEPAVCYIDVECNSESRIADSFSEFLQMLELNLENETVLQNVANFDAARQRLESIFGATFKDKISTIGVPTSILQVGKKWDECLLILACPNFLYQAL